MKKQEQRNYVKLKREVKQKITGITLIALVITIIVLLILASITVTFVLGENGIITKANYAEFATRISAVKEQVNLKKAESKLESITFPGIAYTDENPYGPIQIWGYETVFGDGWYHLDKIAMEELRTR